MKAMQIWHICSIGMAGRWKKGIKLLTDSFLSEKNGKLAASLLLFFLAVLLGCHPSKKEQSVEVDNRNQCINQLKQIESAKDQIEQYEQGVKIKVGDPVPVELLTKYHGWSFKCPSGGTYTINPIGRYPTCSVRGHAIPTMEWEGPVPTNGTIIQVAPGNEHTGTN